MYKTSNYWSRDTFKLDFSEKGLGLVSPPHSVYDFWRKIFSMLYSIIWPHFIVWLPLLLKILGNMCITIVSYPDSDVIKFEINLIFLIKPFFYMTKKSRQKFKYLVNKKNFWGEIRSIFYIFQLAKIVSDLRMHLLNNLLSLKLHNKYLFVVYNLTQQTMKFFQNLLCSLTPWVLLSQSQLVRNHFLVSLPKKEQDYMEQPFGHFRWSLQRQSPE